MLFHNGHNYEYHFKIKKLEKFKTQFKCFGKNAETYINFSVPIDRELRNNKIVIYRIRFIDSYRFVISYYQIL